MDRLNEQLRVKFNSSNDRCLIVINGKVKRKTATYRTSIVQSVGELDPLNVHSCS